MILKIKKNKDERGWLAETFRADRIGDFKQVYVATIAPQETRANHYHKKKLEWLCVIKGKAAIKLANKTFKVSDKDLKLIRISPLTLHKITNIGKEDLYVIVASSKLYNKKNPDTYQDIERN